MKKTNIIKQLQERNYIVQITDEKSLNECLSKGPVVLYCGFDPTADSLHLGHLIPLLCLRRFQLAGHFPIAVIGGATGLIGDPSFKNTIRTLHNTELIHAWVEKIICQISRFLDFNCGKNSAIILNNYDWFHSMSILTFLRDIGKYFSVNKMIHKESVKKRLKNNINGLSFTEFSYSIIQGYDFAYLNKTYNVILQIGGSDQWGNIISGIDLTHLLYRHTTYGLTMPLITKSDGTKFGKTEDNNTIWLDSKKTSPYNFYQFWINTSDEDVYRFLKLFTFLEISFIQNLEKEKLIKKAQYLLADEVTRIVHGEQNLINAKRITKTLFTNKFINLTEHDFIQLTKDGMPTIILNRYIDLQQALVYTKLASSRQQARNMISSNAITVNGVKKTFIGYVFNNYDIVYNRYTIIGRGKKHFYLIQWNNR